MAKKKGRLELVQMKQAGEKVAWITAYDFPTASFAEAAGMDSDPGGRLSGDGWSWGTRGRSR